MNKFKVFLAVSFIVMILTPLALGAVQGSTCDYNDGGEMIYMGMTSWEIVLSYYDSNHDVRWLIRRYRVYMCNVDSSHVVRSPELKDNIPTEQLINYGIVI